MVSIQEIVFDIAILGGGPAGYVAAVRATQLGAKVVVIEKDQLGGVCLNVGCIPTKALLKTAEVANTIKRSKEFGIENHIDKINWNIAIDRKDRVVKNLVTGLDQLLKAKGIVVIKGLGVVQPDQSILVQVLDESISIKAEKLILTTGAKPLFPNIKGIDLKGVLTSNEALSLDVLPEQIVIIGAGVIGLEFAEMYNSVGVKVTVVEQRDRILPDVDLEIAVELLKIMKRKGIAFRLSASVEEIKRSDKGLSVLYSMNGKPELQFCENVLIAVGRKLNQENFKELPVKIEKGAIVVDEHMESSIKDVYAAGDIIGGKLLAHLAFMEGKVAAENAMGFPTRINYDAVPSCIYTNPEIAMVGLSEEEAIRRGIRVKTGRFQFRHNGRALTLGEREGFVKVISDEENTLIGGQILGINASEIISELTLAITLKAKANDLADMIHPHPSLGEAIWEACGDLLGRSIHQI